MYLDGPAAERRIVVSVRIVLVDDHKIVRDGLRSLLESEEEIESKNGE